MSDRKAMVDRGLTGPSVRRQCALLGVNRNRLAGGGGGVAGPGANPRPGDLELCRLIDEIHLRAPAFGSRQIARVLRLEHGHRVGRGRVRRLMRLMGVRALYRRPRTSLPGSGAEHRVYPYLLGTLKVDRPDQAWCADITYIPMGRGFAYLVAVMDWHTRAVLSWRVSNTLDAAFCLEAFEEAVRVAGRAPEIFNTDQGCQFTGAAWRGLLEGHGVRISMDGKGRWVDNVFVERLWRSVKYEEVYLHEYADLAGLERGLRRWFEDYNTWRPHSSLGERRPWEAYRPAPPAPEACA